MNGSPISEEATQLLKDRMAKDPDISLIIGSSIGTLMPHIALAKLLLEKGIVTKEELNAAYDKHFDAAKYPKGLADMVKPIWDSVRKSVG